jgi:hypothetical protein
MLALVLTLAITLLSALLAFLILMPGATN